MRVLTTWIYFNRSQIDGSRERRRHRARGPEEDADDGIGVAWFAGDTPAMMQIGNLKAFRPIRRNGIEGEPLTEERLRELLDLFLVDADEFEFEGEPRRIRNQAIVDYILEQPIVIERSPPFTVTLKGLLTSTNLPIWIGTYLGWSVAPDRSVLLFITVPGGIIIVSSAIGLANALAAGLSKSVKRLFDRR